MFAGHIGAALAIGRLERRVNVGWFVAASLLPDFLLWAFILLGWESVSLPADFAATHQPAFVFPYSHGLLAGLAWSAAAAALAATLLKRLGATRWRAAACVAAAVFSHWLLDALVHRPEMPLAGAGSPLVGIGLWQHMGAALIVESAIVGAGLYVFLRGGDLPRRRALALAALGGVVLVFTVLGMTVAPPPPSAAAMAASSLAVVVAVAALVLWLGRKPRHGPS